MKAALRRKASTRLVERREEVLALVAETLEIELPDVVTAARESARLEAAADDLGLGVVGDAWGERLEIKRKGGGLHFDDAAREQAALAQRRLASLNAMVGWRKSLHSRAEQVASVVSSFQQGGGAALARTQVLARLTDLLQALRKTVDEITGDGSFPAATREMAAMRVPQTLAADAHAARLAALGLAGLAHQLASRELEGLRAERPLTRRFRASQTLAVLQAAQALVRDVAGFAPADADGEAEAGERLEFLRAAVGEVEPMVQSAQRAAAEEEENDAI
jgi:hypothetical protein